VARAQARIVERLERLEAARAESAPAREPRRVLGFLDGFRANEALGEASLGAWVAVCREPGLRGGLRTVARREAMHARLLEERLKELGGSPRYELPEDVCERAMRAAARTDLSDAKKLLAYVEQLGDVEAALAPIAAMADRLDADPETQSLLRSIMQDERASLCYLREACARLNA
jgi:hypothetical protein